MFNNRGFTMIEVLVMTTIVIVGIISTITVANVAVQSSDTNEKRVAATNLAREGLELVRNMRDSNWAISAYYASVGSSARWNWDCYGTIQTYYSYCSNPYGGQFTAQPVNATRNYIVNPGIGEGLPYPTVPYLTVPAANPAQTKAGSSPGPGVYEICLSTAGYYQPVSGAGVTCATPANTPSLVDTPSRYYRRVEVTRITASGTTSLRIRAYVTWPGRKGTDGNPIVLETYLTDWRTF